MDNNRWMRINDVFVDVIKELIDKKVITVDEHYTLAGGVAAEFTGALSKLENRIQEQKELEQMFDAMKKHFPEEYKKFIEQKI